VTVMKHTDSDLCHTHTADVRPTCHVRLESLSQSLGVCGVAGAKTKECVKKIRPECGNFQYSLVITIPRRERCLDESNETYFQPRSVPEPEGPSRWRAPKGGRGLLYRLRAVPCGICESRTPFLTICVNICGWVFRGCRRAARGSGVATCAGCECPIDVGQGEASGNVRRVCFVFRLLCKGGGLDGRCLGRKAP